MLPWKLAEINSFLVFYFISISLFQCILLQVKMFLMVLYNIIVNYNNLASNPKYKYICDYKHNFKCGLFNVTFKVNIILNVLNCNFSFINGHLQIFLNR